MSLLNAVHSVFVVQLMEILSGPSHGNILPGNEYLLNHVTVEKEFDCVLKTLESHNNRVLPLNYIPMRNTGIFSDHFPEAQYNMVSGPIIKHSLLLLLCYMNIMMPPLKMPYEYVA